MPSTVVPSETPNIPTTPQVGDVNDTDLAIGEKVTVFGWQMIATVTRIHYRTLWITYEDGEDGCVARVDVEKLPSVANLHATVTVYEVNVEDLFMPEIENVEYIGVKCFVLVTPTNPRWRQFHGYVEATFPDYGVALVRKVGSTWRELFTLDEMKLIYGAGVAEESELAAEEKTLHTEMHSVS